MFGKKDTGRNALHDRLAHIAAKPAPNVAGDDLSANENHGRKQRAPTYMPGFLRLSNGECMQVAVKNIDAGGARIEFYGNSALPEEVYLSVGARTRVKARVMWQNENAAGLRFV